MEAFMNDPLRRQTEVIVQHRLGYWWPVLAEDEITEDMVAESDAYLEAHIQWRIEEAARAARYAATGGRKPSPESRARIAAALEQNRRTIEDARDNPPRSGFIPFAGIPDDDLDEFLREDR